MPSVYCGEDSAANRNQLFGKPCFVRWFAWLLPFRGYGFATGCSPVPGYRKRYVFLVGPQGCVESANQGKLFD